MIGIILCFCYKSREGGLQYMLHLFKKSECLNVIGHYFLWATGAAP